MKPPPFFDVIVIGAGLSGIGAAYHLQHDCPNLSFAILEGRGEMGGTWDLFRYPGVRSDSDMFTLGFPFFPWKNPKAIADGTSILEYIKTTAQHFNLTSKIRFHHKAIRADWSSVDNRWTVEIAPHQAVDEPVLQCRFLFACSGYYDYEQGHTPIFEGSESFEGRIIHPQHWDNSLDYAGKKIVVIGSGATAITLVPAMAERAAQVVMLQRSPTYIINMPSQDPLADLFQRFLPNRLAHAAARWKNLLWSLFFYKIARHYPDATKRFLKKNIQQQLGDAYEERHFDPAYQPWDERLCLVPDGDLFHSLQSGKARIVTDRIERFTSKGILLQSGQTLEADWIVTATGLKIQLFGGMVIQKDGQTLDISTLHCYKGVLMSDLPNFAIAIGYTNASWTLKCDLNAVFVTRLLQQMAVRGFSVCTPRYDAAAFTSEPLLDFKAGYVRRAAHLLPKQGSKSPWKVYQNYLRDLWTLRYAPLMDKYLEFK